MKTGICKICYNTTNTKFYTVKEMMFGFRDEFEYFKCDKCGCLQISEIPQNISKYYPADYYSFSTIDRERPFKKLKVYLKRQIIKYRLAEKNILGRVLTKFLNYYYWVIKDLCNFNSKILDIGCGNGNLLLDLNELGFRNLTGIDPYIDHDLYYDNGVAVLKKEIGEISGVFDLVILNHSLEHIQNQKEVLCKVNACLNQGSYLIIFIPVVSGYAFRKYGVNWVQLDAPRHFFVHTPTSMNVLAKEAGFKITKTLYDSTQFQFTGSERYENDKSLFEDHEFTRKQLKFFKKESEYLNHKNDGDSAVFYLQKI